MTTTTLSQPSPALSPLLPASLGESIGASIGASLRTPPSETSSLAGSLRALPRRTWEALRHRGLAARIARAVAAGRPIVLGDAACPYEDLPDRHTLLELLECAATADRPGLSITLRCRADERAPRTSVVDDVAQLARLDRDHAVTVELHLPSTETLPQPTHLEAARRLAARGLTVRLVLPVAAAGRRLRPSLLEAHAAGIYDVALDPSAPPAAAARLDRLRFETGFPQPLPSRG